MALFHSQTGRHLIKCCMRNTDNDINDLKGSFNPSPHRDTLNTVASRADPDQAALVRAA